jgi:ABC-type glycerol-3-phosphate transport system substrate-binding protein
MQTRIPVLAAALLLSTFAARAADLVVWWDKGYSPEEDKAVGETVAAFEQASGKQVELAFYPQAELPNQIQKALEALASTGVVEIRGARRRAERPSTSLARCAAG